MPFDLMPYICPPNGKQYRLFGLGDENCQCVQAGDGWIEFRKNRHMEEFYVTDTVIGRGADTSEISNDGVHPVGEFYIQYTRQPDGTLRYGAAWARRQMSVGDTFHRDVRVIRYKFDGSVLSEGDAATDLVVNAHYNALTFQQSGITIQDVLELQWGGQEVYYYANGYGLVGWKNLVTQQMSYVGVESAFIQEPFPHDVKPRPQVPRPSPVPVPPVVTHSAETNPQAMQVNQTSGIWLLDAPGIQSGHIRILPFGEVVVVFASPVASASGFDWQRVNTARGEQGWSAMVVSGVESFVPTDAAPVMPTPTPTPTPMPTPPPMPAGTHPQRMQVNQTNGIWLLDAPGIQSGHIRILPFRENVTVYAEPVANADGFAWQRVDTALGEHGWSAMVIGDTPSFVALDAGHGDGGGAHTPPAHPEIHLASPVTVPFDETQPFGVNFTGIPDFYTQWNLPAHEGLDFGGRLGDPIFAAASGRVIAINIPGEGTIAVGHPYGIHVKLRHQANGQTFQTDYCHLSGVAPGLAVNQDVQVGQSIGLMGMTGAANGRVHLHFNLHIQGVTAAGEKQTLPDGREVTYKNDLVDPASYL